MKKIYKSRVPNNSLSLLIEGKIEKIIFKEGLYETSDSKIISSLDSFLDKQKSASFYEYKEVTPVSKKTVESKAEETTYDVAVKAEPKEEKAVDVVEYDAATVQSAARVLCDNYNLSMREVNTIAKIEAKAKELGCVFPKLRK